MYKHPTYHTILHGIETDDIMYYMFAKRCESRLNNVTTFCHHLTLYLSYYTLSYELSAPFSTIFSEDF